MKALRKMLQSHYQVIDQQISTLNNTQSKSGSIVRFRNSSNNSWSKTGFKFVEKAMNSQENKANFFPRKLMLFMTMWLLYGANQTDRDVFMSSQSQQQSLDQSIEHGKSFQVMINRPDQLHQFLGKLISKYEPKPDSTKPLIFLIYTNETDPKFDSRVNQVLETVIAKMNAQGKLFVIMRTSNIKLLTHEKWFRIIPQNDYSCVRLIDLWHQESPIVKEQNKTQEIQAFEQQRVNPQQGEPINNYFRKYPYKEPFDARSISSFLLRHQESMMVQKENAKHDKLKNLNTQSHQNSKSMSQVKFAYPGDFDQRVGGQSDKEILKLVLFHKQGCQGCKIVDGLLKQLVEMQSKIKKLNQKNPIVKEIYQKTILNQYPSLQSLSDIELLMNRTKILKYNILNEDKNFPSPGTTPTVCLFPIRKGEQYSDFKDRKYSQVKDVSRLFGQLKRLQDGEKDQQKVYKIMLNQFLSLIKTSIKQLNIDVKNQAN